LGAQVVAHPAGDKGYPQSFAKPGGIWFVLRQDAGASIEEDLSLARDTLRA
jgi:hypothetical protein